MRAYNVSALSFGLVFLLATACSSGGGGGDTVGGTGAGMSTGSGCPGNVAAAAGSGFCAGDPSNIDCTLVTAADKDQVCGVAVPSPTMELARSSNVMEFAGSGPPDLSCYTAMPYPAAGTSMMVTMSGVAKIFSHGCQSSSLTIEVHTVMRTGGANDGEVGPIVGTAVTTAADCTATGVMSTADCGTRYECKYSYPNVPTETELAILTNGAQWAPLYEYNNYIPNAAVTGGMYTHDVRALASDDYSAIPAVTSLGGPIDPGLGALAGEVHDCGNVRLTNATVDTNVSRRAFTYFDSNEQSPLPLSSQTATSVLGLYAAFDLKPGPASVAALGLVSGKITTVGYFKAFIHANSVTAVTFQGLRPFQVKP